MAKCLRNPVMLLVVILLVVSGTSIAQVAISVSFGPPALPVYTQPICPAPGYIWVPGYWAWDPNYGDYYWVPGTWVLAPQTGYLWTPPWWGWNDGAYLFHPGYWGPSVGFYGGINYGYGYYGHGYEGGRWNNGTFYYNRAVNNINVTNIRNYYSVSVPNRAGGRVSYNGGTGGIEARPTSAEEAAGRERHIGAVAAQTQQVDAAKNNQQLRATVNKGRPPVAATSKPGSFSGAGVVRASAAGAPYHPPAKAAAPEASSKQNVPHPPNETASRPEAAPASRSVPRPPTPVHARDVPEHSAPSPSRPANTQAERQAQERQQQLDAQQQQEHQKLAQQQEQDHQRMAQQKASNAQMQAMERQHQQQTMQMEQRHAQQQQQMERSSPAPPHNQAAPHAAPSERH